MLIEVRQSCGDRTRHFHVVPATKKNIKEELNTEQSNRYTNIVHHLIATKC